MANTVQVGKLNTFEEWRLKCNEMGIAIGDLDLIPIDVGGIQYNNILEALEALANAQNQLQQITVYNHYGVKIFPL